MRPAPELEGLESRRLLAAAPATVSAVVTANGTLDVVGTRKADVIVVGLDAANPAQLIVTAEGATVDLGSGSGGGSGSGSGSGCGDDNDND